MTFYTDNLIPADSAGCTRGPVIFIRPKYRNDIGLLRHEECHVRQWLRTLGVHSILYLMSKAYRLKAEVEAYREQLSWPHPKYGTGELADKYASFLSTKYGLDITKEQAREMLS